MQVPCNLVSKGINMAFSRKEKVYMLMVLPALSGFLILFILPTLMSFSYSFTNWSVYKPQIKFIGMDNFGKLFSEKQNLAAIAHSVAYALVITVVQNVLAILLASFLFNTKGKSSDFVKSCCFLPAVLSILVVGYLFKYIMTSADYGVLNYVLSLFGIGSVNWLGDSNLALWSVLSTQVWQWTGWSMVIYMANLKSIDTSLYEAARIDGAGGVDVFTRITLPLLYPAASFNILMSLIGGLKVFDAVFAMTGGGPGYASETIMTSLIREGFNNGRNAYACAFAMVFFAIVFVVSRVVTTILNKWERSIA